MPAPIRRRRLLGGGVIQPASLPGLQLWLKADAITGLSDGAGVSSWVDSSGLGRNAVQVTGADQPLYKVNQLHGLPGVVSSGSPKYLSVSSLPLSTFTAFVVFQASANGIIYEQSSNSNKGANAGSAIYTTTAFSINAARGVNGANASAKDYVSNWGSDNVAKRAAQSFDGTHAGHTLTVNGGSVSLTTYSTSNQDPGTSTVTDTLFLMARAGTSLFLPGTLYEIIFYSPVLSPAQQASIDRYLKNKWALP
jgi:hypothetical protein